MNWRCYQQNKSNTFKQQKLFITISVKCSDSVKRWVVSALIDTTETIINSNDKDEKRNWFIYRSGINTKEEVWLYTSADLNLWILLAHGLKKE